MKRLYLTFNQLQLESGSHAVPEALCHFILPQGHTPSTYMLPAPWSLLRPQTHRLASETGSVASPNRIALYECLPTPSAAQQRRLVSSIASQPHAATQLNSEGHWHGLKQRPIYPVSIAQLDHFCRRPTAQRLQTSATHLCTEVSARLGKHVLQLLELQQPHTSPERAFASKAAEAKLALMHWWDDAWERERSFLEPGGAAFCEVLRNFRNELESAMSRIQAESRQLTQTSGWWQTNEEAQQLNRCLDLCHMFAIGMRLMITQHLAAWDMLQNSQSDLQGKLVDMPASMARPKDTSPDWGPTRDPRLGNVMERSMVSASCHLLPMVQLTIEDCRAFCVEKNSTAPEVHAMGEPGLKAMIVAPYVEFILVELLKNAMQAMINRYGAWDVDEAPPVQVVVERADANGDFFCITVKDAGGGIPPERMFGMFSYFSSAAAERPPRYGYSRDFGAAIQGLGVGVPLSRVYAHFMGGSLQWDCDRGAGTTIVRLSLPLKGFQF